MILIVYGESTSRNLTLMLHTSKISELSEDCEKPRPKHVAAVINKFVFNIMCMY